MFAVGCQFLEDRKAVECTNYVDQCTILFKRWLIFIKHINVTSNCGLKHQTILINSPSPTLPNHHILYHETGTTINTFSRYRIDQSYDSTSITIFVNMSLQQPSTSCDLTTIGTTFPAMSLFRKFHLKRCSIIWTLKRQFTTDDLQHLVKFNLDSQLKALQQKEQLLRNS